MKPDLVMSDLFPCFCDEMERLGFNIIPTKNIEIFHKPERKHADMQLLKIEKQLFTLDSCMKKAGKSYPDNVLLNCFYINKTLYGKLSAIDKSVIKYCVKNGIKTVNVNQGYTRCSTLQISNNAVITADKSIEKAMKSNGADVLLISPGAIRLDGFDYGFIGGAGLFFDNRVYFFGNIQGHPDYIKIINFCEKHKTKIRTVCPHMELTDIGGAVAI